MTETKAPVLWFARKVSYLNKAGGAQIDKALRRLGVRAEYKEKVREGYRLIPRVYRLTPAEAAKLPGEPGETRYLPINDFDQGWDLMEITDEAAFAELTAENGWSDWKAVK